MNKIPVITIDGPSGSGKGTISQLLANKLKWHFLDSGALYRVLAYAAQLHQIDLSDQLKLISLAHNLDVQFHVHQHGLAPRVILEEQDVTDLIRQEACGRAASFVAAIGEVRQALLERQRAFQQAPGLVADGRDMGTIVFPQAQLKLFLTASVEERAQRRFKQLQEKGINVSLSQILQDLNERDKRDQSRAYAPMQPADDAIIIDTTGLSVAAVFQRILSEVDKHVGK